MSTILTHLSAVTLLASAALMPGCQGGLTRTEPVSVGTGYEATQAAMSDLEFTVRERAKDALQARVTAMEADNTEVTVNMKAKGEHLTEFRIKVGIFGDDTQAQLIMDKIKKHF